MGKHEAYAGAICVVAFLLFMSFGGGDSAEKARIAQCAGLADYAQKHNLPEPSCVKDTLGSQKK